MAKSIPQSERPKSERGAALLTVLLLVAMMAVISATALDRLLLSTRLAANASAQQQARGWLLAAEGVASARIEDLVAASRSELTLQANWTAPQTLPLPGGTVRARVSDGGNCFNINSLVEKQDGRLVPNLTGIRQFNTLMTTLGVSAWQAQRIADGGADWLDSDASPRPAGAEDSVYRGLGYLPPNDLAGDASEFRALSAMDARAWALLAPYLCALPVAELSPINVNTLAPEQAALLVMLGEGKIGAAQARGVLARRPASGYGSTVRFWAQPDWGEFRPEGLVGEQTKVTTRWFRLDAEVAMGDGRLNERALLDAGKAPVRVVSRSWSAGR